LFATGERTRRVLITGLEGFVGQHLATELAGAEKQKVFGSIRRPELRVDLPLPSDRISACDLLDRAAVEELVERIKPDFIYHLAGKADLGGSWQEPGETIRANLMGTLNLIQAVLIGSPKCRVLAVSTGGVYGRMLGDQDALKEDSCIAPVDPYSVSKAAVELLCWQYFESHGLQAIIARSFNHIGPGQSPRFLVGRVAKCIAEIEANVRAPVLALGNLSSRRDFTDVRDVVRAYRALMDRGRAGEVYNVASGRAVEIGQVVQSALSFSEVPIRLEAGDDRARPLDSPVLIGDSSKLRSHVGWEPTVSIEESILDALNYARSRVRDFRSPSVG